jgi:hypothetical protein
MGEILGLDLFGADLDIFGEASSVVGERKGRLVTFVIDYSLSARQILPAAAVTCYDIMNRCLLSDGKQTTFGLLIYGNGDQMKPVFSDSPSVILEHMFSAKNGGGSGNGVENTGEALRLACKSMQTIRTEEGAQAEIPPENRVLFLFTDSPSSEEADLRRMARKKDIFEACPPIRSAVLFVPAETRAFQVHASRYQFPMVDGQGRADRHRAPYIFPLETVVRERVLQNAETSEDWIDQLLAAIS